MAHKMTATARDTLASLTECRICMSEIEHPKTLPCLHSFCLKCLKETTHANGILTCQWCKEEMTLPPEGVDALRDSFFINQLKDWKAIQKIGEIKISCICCKSTVHHTNARCVDCDGFLCEQCISLHKTLTPLVDHNILSTDELRSGQTKLSEMKKERFCHIHVDQVLELFCKTCGIPICRHCTLMKSAHQDHNYVTIENVTEVQTEEIKSLMIKCRDLSKRLKDAMDETEKIKNNLNETVNKIKIEIDKERKEYMEAIQRSYEGNMEKLSQIQQVQLEKINPTIESFELMQTKLIKALEIASQVVDSGSKLNIASNYSTICTTLTQFKDYNPCGLNKEIASCKFKPSQKSVVKSVNIGDVSTEERLRNRNGRWILEKYVGQKGGEVNAITVGPDKSLLVIVTHACNAKINIFDQDGHLKQCIDRNILSPSDITKCSSGFYVTDGTPYVKCFNHNYNYVMRFPAKSTVGSASNVDKSTLRGIAADNDGNVLVGNYSSQYISKHRADGMHISSFDIGIQPRYLKVLANNRKVVTSQEINVPAHILDHNGKLLHTVHGPKDTKFWRFSGIACSDDGCLFIANYEDSIYSFTEDGEYLGCVVKDLTTACDLDMYDDKLVVAETTGLPIKVYTYKED